MGNSGSAGAAQQAVQVDSKIKEQFNKYKDPRDNTIKRDKFQEALSVADSTGQRKLKDSPLADLIFDLFAHSNPVSITEKEFHACAIALASSSTPERTETTFRAIAGHGHDHITFDTIVELFERSWRAACRSLIAKRKLRVKAVGGEDFTALIEAFCEKNLGHISDEVRGNLLKYDKTGKGSLDRAEFFQWLSLDRTVKVVVDTDTVEVPTSLTHQKSSAAYPQLNA